MHRSDPVIRKFRPVLTCSAGSSLNLKGSVELLTQHYALELVPVLIRLVFDCFATLLNIFARAFNRIATGKCRGSASQE
jgi:hypothetical protein